MSKVMMDEAKLIEKLRLVEALFAGATTEGEQVAADHARQRILERLRAMEAEDPPVEYRFSMEDMWSRRVFVALLRRYGITPYRYRRQRYTTVMARVSKRFVDETLWPQFERLSDTLRQYLSEVTDRVVVQVISEDLSKIRVAQYWAGPAFGAMYIPRKDHEVIVEFIDGDPDRPIITGRVYNGLNVPLYPLPKDQTISTIMSPSRMSFLHIRPSPPGSPGSAGPPPP